MQGLTRPGNKGETINLRPDHKDKERHPGTDAGLGSKGTLRAPEPEEGLTRSEDTHLGDSGRWPPRMPHSCTAAGMTETPNIHLDGHENAESYWCPLSFGLTKRHSVCTTVGVHFQILMGVVLHHLCTHGPKFAPTSDICKAFRSTQGLLDLGHVQHTLQYGGLAWAAMHRDPEASQCIQKTNAQILLGAGKQSTAWEPQARLLSWPPPVVGTASIHTQPVVLCTCTACLLTDLNALSSASQDNKSFCSKISIFGLRYWYCIGLRMGLLMQRPDFHRAIPCRMQQGQLLLSSLGRGWQAIDTCAYNL